jgi:hypothetical protein
VAGIGSADEGLAEAGDQARADHIRGRGQITSMERNGPSCVHHSKHPDR